MADTTLITLEQFKARFYPKSALDDLDDGILQAELNAAASDGERWRRVREPWPAAEPPDHFIDEVIVVASLRALLHRGTTPPTDADQGLYARYRDIVDLEDGIWPAMAKSASGTSGGSDEEEVVDLTAPVIFSVGGDHECWSQCPCPLRCRHDSDYS